MNMPARKCGGCGSQRGCECCGAGDCASRCCELACLVRPNFFCGQMLTDADLAAMVEWTRTRLALARYRDGWGIACGLDLSCGAPQGVAAAQAASASGPAVYLSRGYALDCCGNDLVVCEPIRIDLAAVCRPADDPCRPRPVAQAASVPAQDNVPAPATCTRIADQDLFAVRLWLRYGEDLAQGQRAMFGGACAEQGPCQYSRVLEQPCVHLEPITLAELGGLPVQEDRWQRAFQPRLEEQVNTVRAVLDRGIGAVAQSVSRKRPYQLCFMEAVACCVRDQPDADGARARRDLAKLGWYLLIDWLLHELQRPCDDCKPDQGVALGNVLLRRSLVERRLECTVVMIEQGIPERRLLRKDTWRSLPAGAVDLADYIWQPAAAAVKRLLANGIQVTQQALDPDAAVDGAPPPSVEETGKFALLTLSVDPSANRKLIAHTIHDVVDTQRIGFFTYAVER